VSFRTADSGTTPFSFLTVLSLPYPLERFVPRVAASSTATRPTTTEEKA